MQLRNLINRRNVPKKPKQDVNACEDFIGIVAIAHIVAAAMEVLSTQGMPGSHTLPDDIGSTSQAAKSEILQSLTKKIITSFVFLKPFEKTTTVDGVLDYAKEVLTLSLFYAEFDDAIKEGDGERLIRCWKFLLVLFKSSGQKNYSIEALTLLSQFYIRLPPRLAQQLAWSRVVNTSGKPGGNKPCDLEMEHLNRACKDGVSDFHANVTPKAFVRLGKCIGPLTKLCKQFDTTSGIPPVSGRHSTASFDKDLKTLIIELSSRSQVFKEIKGRKHDGFRTFTGSLLHKPPQKELLKWMKEKLSK